MEKLHLRPGHTLAACFVGYITQAIINNFAPLLFVTFNTTYGTSLTLIGAMITINFGVQLLVDLLAARFVDKIGYRPCIVAAHLFLAAALFCSPSCRKRSFPLRSGCSLPPRSMPSAADLSKC